MISLIKINPAYICYVSPELTNKKDFLQRVAIKCPMSIVHMYGMESIKKEIFMELCQHNPMILQNYCAFGDYGLVDREMIEAMLYQPASSAKTYAELVNAFDVAYWCVQQDNYEHNNISFKSEDIEQIAKYALAGPKSPVTIDELIDKDGNIDPDEYRANLISLIRKYPQAIRTLNKWAIEVPEGTNEDGSIYYEDIEQAMRENPEIGRFYNMQPPEFEAEMNERLMKEYLQQKVVELSSKYKSRQELLQRLKEERNSALVLQTERKKDREQRG